MKYILSLILSFIIIQTAYSQIRITYGIRQDGKESTNDSIVVYISKETMQITRPSLTKERQYIDFTNKQTIQTLNKDDNSFYILKKAYSEKSPEVVHEYPIILDYPCLKTILNVRSNKIEVYYTEKTEYKGGPFLYLSEIPGLVLKVVRNGNYEVYAKRIDVSEDIINQTLIPNQSISEINEAEFQQRLIESRYKTFQIFSNENLYFKDSLINNFNKEIINTSKGSVVLKKIDLPPVTNNTIVIAELTVRSNGDAYDRTGSVFAIPVTGKKNFLEAFEKGTDYLPKYVNDVKGITSTDNFDPPVELVRFITSFGTGYFGKEININGLNWKDSIVYRLEVSDIIKGLKNFKDVYVGAFIGNWDKGGHIVSLRLKFFEENEYENKVNWVVPLFNTINYMEMEGQGYPNLFKKDTLSVTATIPEGVKNAKLKFVTTGHGDDEFIPRLHKILLDGKEIFSFIPWRTDCASYRENNPASGNFLNGMSSSDYSRSNWCPGMVVNPYEIKLAGLKPGKHIFKVIVECGDNSYWNVSGCLLGE
jgi:GLPGLI family protein